jgi:tRNA pseudouridine(55) synthase
MIEFYKKRGETPLQALNRLRLENPKLTTETLSYAGRLDPMAEGVLPVLVGEENKNRQEFLGKDKEYRASFLLGCSSDTGDVLGVLKEVCFKDVEDEKIKEAFLNLITIKKQIYPWYSSKTVKGIPLFEYAQKKIFDIVRPTREVEIYSVTDIDIQKINFEKIKKEIIEDIENVRGDFRQEEIIENWKHLDPHSCESRNLDTTLLDPRFREDDDRSGKDFDFMIQIASCTLKVSSGTYIRALTDELTDKLGCPVTLYKLVRTRIF